MNILSFDVERWDDSFYLKAGDGMPGLSDDRAVIGVTRILEILKPKQIKATFFMVGKLAEKRPEIVKKIQAEGHEIASHGYSHRPINSMTPDEFREDLVRSLAVLKGITGEEVLGYRAPGYTITKSTLWAIDVIKEAGLIYDSSIYPVSLSLFTQGGASGFPQEPFYIRKGLMEFPLITTNIMGIKLPIATTSYFRIFPYNITRWAIQCYSRKGWLATLNYHSWEFDPDQPVVKLPFPQNFKHYNNLDKTAPRLEKLINDFNFTGFKQVLKSGIGR